MSTSVTPPYLKPFVKQPSKITYTDGGQRNNPIFWAADEYRKVWDRPGAEAKLDVLVSIGAGIFPPTNQQSAAALIYTQGLRGENIWSDFIQKQIQHAATSHRLNVIIEGLHIKPDGYNGMDALVTGFNKAIVDQDRHHILDKNPSPASFVLRDKINYVAHILVAKLFFFDPTGPVIVVNDPNGGGSVYQIEGKILCRLRQGSHPLEKLIERISGFGSVESERETEAHQISGTGASEHFSTIDITKSMEAVRKGMAFEINHTITSSHPNQKFQTIYIQLQYEAVIPRLKIDETDERSEVMVLGCVDTRLAISGFPCKFYGNNPDCAAGGGAAANILHLLQTSQKVLRRRILKGFNESEITDPHQKWAGAVQSSVIGYAFL